jgi:hypothetical protein
MWHRNSYNQGERAATADGHELHMFYADAWCKEADHDHSADPLPAAAAIRPCAPAAPGTSSASARTTP